MTTLHARSPNSDVSDFLSFDLLNNGAERDFDGILEISAEVTNATSSFITLLHNDNLWVKSLNEQGFVMPDPVVTFCWQTISSGAPLFVSDTQTDDRFKNNPFVEEAPFVRAYAGFPLKTRNGNCIGTICTIDYKPRQFTRKQKNLLFTLAEQVVKIIELRKKNELLQVLNDSKERKKIALNKLLQHQEKVMAILSHDTRGPLVFIKEMLQMVKCNQLGQQEAPELFGLMECQVGNTLSLIENLTNWGMARIGENNLPDESFDLADLVNDAFKPYSLAAAQKGITFRNQIKKGNFTTHHNETVTFIIRNLLNNAVKYTDAGKITVTGKQKEKYYEIAVADTGIGMPKSMLDYLFITKFDSRTGTHGEQGSGIGLMLIFDFVEQLNGYIEVESKEGKGTKFRIGLPYEE